MTTPLYTLSTYFSGQPRTCADTRDSTQFWGDDSHAQQHLVARCTTKAEAELYNKQAYLQPVSVNTHVARLTRTPRAVLGIALSEHTAILLTKSALIPTPISTLGQVWPARLRLTLLSAA